MKILLANKYFHVKGGADKAFLDTAELLRGNGHEAVFFSMLHPQNAPSADTRHFVSHVDFENCKGVARKLAATGRMLYYFEAKRKMRGLIRERRPDIAHLHNIYHQLSPSVIDALKGAGIPVVMTLHDYKLTCASYLHLSDGKICERCAGGRHYNAVLRRCVKSSLAKSALGAAEMYLHHTVLKVYDRVDVFIAPSRFMSEKAAKSGVKGKVVHLSNFVDADHFKPSFESAGNYAVYFGRLSREKGLGTLLEAVKGLDARLLVIGDGPMKGELSRMIESGKMKNVELLGYRSGRELHELIRGAAFTVVPSEWYENNPMSVLESFALGKPVVGARIGGIPELVVDGRTGLLFMPGDPSDLRERMRSLFDDRELAREMGVNARRTVVEEFSRERHYKGLMDVYEGCLG